jgi:type IV fimbrial biogenesis protein FimT
MRQQGGFNLVEMLVVMVVAAIMLGIGVPSFRQFTATQRVKSAAFDFAGSLLLARSEAIKRNAAVTVDQAAGGWGSGWTVNAGGTTLAAQDAAAKVTIAPTPDTTASITFQNNGRVGGTLRFQFGAENTDAVRCVTLSVSGLPHTTNTSCS